MKSLLPLSLLVLVLLAAGCQSNPGGSPGRLAGRWVSIEDSANGVHTDAAVIAATFQKDGAFAWRGQNGLLAGTYRVEGDRVTLLDASSSESSPYSFRFYNDYLIVEGKDRFTITFREAGRDAPRVDVPEGVVARKPAPRRDEAPVAKVEKPPSVESPARATTAPQVAKAKPAPPKPAPAGVTPARAESQCRSQLEHIYAAIQAYRKDHKDTPDWLSDLVPKYLPDARGLLCPTGRAPGKLLYGLDDPRLPTSYTYEFCNRPVPSALAAGSSMTMKEWRMDVMGLAGGGTPIVRCHLHDHVLNISFDGEFYESGTEWDRLPRFSDKLDRRKLAPRR
jgi:hypothetical protein